MNWRAKSGAWLGGLACLLVASLPTVVHADNFNVQYRLQAADLSGTPITETYVAATFLLEAFVQDLRPPMLHSGVFAAFIDVDYSPLLSTINPGENFAFGADYPNIRRYDTEVPGLIRHAGAVAGLTGVGSSEVFLWSVPVQVKAAGLATFTPHVLTDDSYLTLIYGSNDPVNPNNVSLIPAVPKYVASPFSMLAIPPAARAGDANSDGTVGFADLGLLLTHFGKSGHYRDGDFNGTGTVTFADLGLMLTNYGRHVSALSGPGSLTAGPSSIAAVAVPEPSTWVLLVCGASLLLVTRRQTKV